MLDAVRQRLIDRVTDLAPERVQGAVQFAELIENGTLPSAPFFAFVIPVGMQGLKPTSMSGIFTQPVTHRINVTLGFRTHSPTSDKAIGDIEARTSDVLDAICGYAPDDASGAFQINSAGLAGFNKGAVFYQLEFAISDQLRITP